MQKYISFYTKYQAASGKAAVVPSVVWTVQPITLPFHRIDDLAKYPLRVVLGLEETQEESLLVC